MCPWLPLVVACIGVAGGVRPARAQSCCGGGGTLTPTRLEHHEAGLLGMRLRTTPVLADFDGSGELSVAPEGTADVESEALLFGALRLDERWQASLSAPLVVTYRAAGAVAGTGGGLGDLALALRWEPIWAAERTGLPGVAFELGATLPTGTPPEEAADPLATDATGLGTWRVDAGAVLEHVFGDRRQWLVTLRTGLRWSAPRTVSGLERQRAIEGVASIGGALVLQNDVALALAADFTWEGRTAVGGRDVSGSSQYLATLAATVGVPFGHGWRLLGGLGATPPIDGLGRNRPLGIAASLTLVYAGFGS